MNKHLTVLKKNGIFNLNLIINSDKVESYKLCKCNHKKYETARYCRLALREAKKYKPKSLSLRRFLKNNGEDKDLKQIHVYIQNIHKELRHIRTVRPGSFESISNNLELIEKLLTQE